MAGGTSRILLNLAIPSIFSLIAVFLFLRRKNPKPNFPIAEGTISTQIHRQALNPMKLKNQESYPIEESATGDMQLKESEATAETQISQSNGVSQLENSQQLNDVENGIAKETNGIKGASVQSLKKQQIRENGVSLDKKIANGNSGNQNGFKKLSKKSKPVPGKTLTNGNTESQLSNGPSSHNEMKDTSISNGFSHLINGKSKKKSKVKLHEKSNSCPKELSNNGCEKDKVSLVSTDSKCELSNGVGALTIVDEACALPDQTVHAITTPLMDSNSLSFVQTEVVGHCKSIDNNSVPYMNGSLNSDFCTQQNVGVDSAKDVCDTVCSVQVTDSQCGTPESGRSSESSSEIIDNLQIDINDALTFPIDLVASASQSAMLPSPELAYCDSLSKEYQQFSIYEVHFQGDKRYYEVSSLCANYLKNIPYISNWAHQVNHKGSNDSGRGASELQFGLEHQSSSMLYEFDISGEHCGFLIGKRGSHINFLKNKTNATIWMRPFPFDKEKKVVSIGGEESEVQAALKLIRRRFPLDEYPDLTLDQTNLPGTEILCPTSLKLALPEGVEFQVVLSATVSAGHFFVQLPTHASYHALPPFTMSMISMYTHCQAPLITSIFIGNVVAAPVGDGWFRAEVIDIYPEDDTCKLKYLDYGGYQIVPKSLLRQINIDLMQMPFQATECYLANISCHEELGWTEESKIAFENLAQGQILSAYVAGVAEDGIPCLHLYKVTGATNTFINQALVEAGFLKWISYDQ